MLTVVIAIVPILVHTVGKYIYILYTNTERMKITNTFSHVLYIEFTHHLESVNTTLNSTVSFTCEAVADEINFRVNDMSATLLKVINKGFTQQPAEQHLNSSKVRRVLLAEALEDNNNTNISCRAINSGIVYSEVAVLMIQGELIL